jgi:hypothetical protein
MSGTFHLCRNVIAAGSLSWEGQGRDALIVLHVIVYMNKII